MLYPIVGYASVESGKNVKHIVYVSQDGHLQDLVCQQGQKWKYKIDITAAARTTAMEVANLVIDVPPVPNATGSLAVQKLGSEASGDTGLPIFYLGSDQQVHLIFLSFRRRPPGENQRGC